MNPLEPLPTAWCDAVMRILSKGTSPNVRWSFRAQQDWQQFGLPFQAHRPDTKKAPMKTTTVPFDIYIPATENRAAIKVDTIRIEIITDSLGNEMVTPASTTLIEKTQARYMGLMVAEDIRSLRDRLGLSQDQLSDALGCGKKSLSRWENGREYPSQLVNTLLRLLEGDQVTLADLRSVRQPLITPGEKIIHFIGTRRNAPHTYEIRRMWKHTDAATAEPLAM